MIQKPFRIVLVAKLSQHISQYSAGPCGLVPERWDKPVSTQLIRFKCGIASGRDYALGILDAIWPDELEPRPQDGHNDQWPLVVSNMRALKISHRE